MELFSSESSTMPEVLGTSKSIYGFDPRSVPECVLWLDGADSSTLFTDTAGATRVTADGNTIGSWRDKSTNSYLFTQATAGNRPTYKTAILNGQSITRWNGTSTGLQSSTTLPFYTSASSGGSFFFVFMVTGNTTQRFLMTYQNQTSGTFCVSESEIGCPTGNVDTGNFGIQQGCSKANVALNQVTTNQYMIMNLNLLSSGTAPANTTIFKNGTSASMTAQNGGFYSGTTYPFANNARYLNIGYRVPVGVFPIDCWLAGDIAEIIWYQTPLPTVQRQAVEGYLARKWGITVPTTHPFFRIPPFTRYFNPVDIPGCQLWLDGMDATAFTFSSGSNISSWNDKSGNSNNANIVTATPPTYSSATKSVVFTAASAMGLRGNMSSSVSNASVFVVTSYTSNAASPASIFNPRLFFLGSNNSTENFLIGQLSLMDRGQTVLVTFVGNGTGGVGIPGENNYQTAVNTSFSTPYIYTNISTYSGTTFTNLTLSNGAAGTYATKTGTKTTDVNYVGSANRYAIGNSIFTTPTANGDSYNGNIYEVILYNTALTPGQRQQIEGYLSWKWGIGLSVITPRHSFFSFPPSALLPFYPTDISGCQMWLDSADSSTITYVSGVSISSWNDKSGTGNNATVSGTAYATYTSNAVLFNNSLYTTPYTGVPNNETAFIVFSTSNGATTNAALIGTSQNGARGIWAGYSGFTGGGFQAVGVVRAGQAWVAGSPANSVPNLTTTMATVTTTTNSATALRLNGSTTTYTGAASYNAGLTYLGRENSTSFGYIGYAMEIIFYNVVLSESQRQRVEGYLASKWNIRLPSTHAYYEFGTSRISRPAPVGTFTPTISGAVITGTWGASSEAVNYTVSLFSSPTSGGTYSISQGPFTTTASTYSFTVTAGNFYRVYVVVNGVIDSSETTISGFVQYVAAAWTPATAVSTGAPLITWFKGDDGLTSTVWSNRGTNGGTATLTNASIASNSQNGLNGVNFTTVPSYGTFTQTFSTQARGCFAVVKFVTVPTTPGQHLVAITNSWDFVLAAGTPLQIMMIQQGIAVRVWSSNVPAMANGTAYVIGCVNSAVSTASNAVIQNGTQYGFQTNSLAASYPVSAQTTFLNYYNSVNCNVACYFYEVLCYSGELAAADITNITGYLRTKWATS